MIVAELPIALVAAVEHAEVLARLRAAFDSARPVRSVVMTEMIVPTAATAMRAIVDPVVASFAIPDRGVYEFVDVAPTAIEPLRLLATRVVGRDLFVHSARAFRLAHGSYQLTLDDHLDQQAMSVAGSLHVEVTLDFSALPTGEGDIVYTDRTSAPVLTAPQLPASVLIVERPIGTSALYRFSRYLPFRVGAQRVHRLRVVLR